jgi:hypothetical protein
MGLLQFSVRVLYFLSIVVLIVVMIYIALALLNRGIQATAKYYGYEVKNFWSWAKRKSLDIDELILGLEQQWPKLSPEQQTRIMQAIDRAIQAQEKGR